MNGHEPQHVGRNQPLALADATQVVRMKAGHGQCKHHERGAGVKVSPHGDDAGARRDTMNDSG